jgi:hypothetical protein
MKFPVLISLLFAPALGLVFPSELYAIAPLFSSPLTFNKDHYPLLFSENSTTCNEPNGEKGNNSCAKT